MNSIARNYRFFKNYDHKIWLHMSEIEITSLNNLNNHKEHIIDLEHNKNKILLIT